jgi:hypothetical protein
MTRFGSIGLLAAALCLAGCAKREPGVYDLSLKEAYDRLSVSDLPDLVRSRQCGILIHVAPESFSDREITWKVNSGGHEVLKFTAVLTPIGEKQTKVEIKVPADPAGGEVYDGKKFYPRPAINQPLRPAVDEQVAAILEGRPWDVSRVGPPTDSVCNVQRGGLESGVRFRVDDPPGTP